MGTFKSIFNKLLIALVIFFVSFICMNIASLADGDTPRYGEEADNFMDTDIDVVSISNASNILYSGVSGDLQWSIDEDGLLSIWGHGDYEDKPGWLEYKEMIKASTINITSITSTKGMFYDCRNIEYIIFDTFDTSSVTDMSDMFYRCDSLKKLDLSCFDTSSVTDMSWMFAGLINLQEVDFSSFDTARVTNMEGMFAGPCADYLDLSNFDTSSVTNMSKMFAGSYIKNLNVNSFDTSKVSSMHGMFFCSRFDKLDLRGFDTSNVIDMSYMFACSFINSIDVSSFDTSSVTDMSWMFYDLHLIKEIDVSSFDTSGVTDMSMMFLGCSDLQSIDISNFNSAIANMDSMFHYCFSLVIVKAPYNVMIDYNSLPVIEGYHWEDENDVYVSNRLLKSEYSKTYRKVENKSDVVFSIDNYGKVSYDDSWIVNAKTNQYNQGLSDFCIYMDTLAYKSNNEAEYYYKALEKCGYKTIDSNYSIRTSSNCDYSSTTSASGTIRLYEAGKYSPYYLTHKYTSNGDVIILLVVRGTTGKEWIDNFETGTGTEHEGFSRAASAIYNNLRQYIIDKKLSDKKIWFLGTGHSRGAATVNLLGGRIDREGISVDGKTVIDSSNSVFYTYATPNGVRTGRDGVNLKLSDSGSKYSNIYNIVNPEDFVTKVIPAAWGYGRYGRTYVIPDSTTSGNGDKARYNTYAKKRDSLFNSYKKTDYQGYSSGMVDVSTYTRYITLRCPNINCYYYQPLTLSQALSVNTLHGLYVNTLGSYCAGDNTGDNTLKKMGLSNFVSASSKYGDVGLYTFSFFFSHNVLDHKFEHAHLPEFYLAAMNSLDDDVEFLTKAKPMIYGIVNCPVDIEIYDSDGVLVGEIKDNVVNENVIDGIEMYVEGDSKSFYLPNEFEYDIRLVGNEEGTMDYSLVEFDPDTGEQRRLFYEKIELTKECEYIENKPTDAELEDLKLFDHDDKEVEADKLIEIDNIRSLEINVETVEGKGYAESYGGLTEGDYVTIKAYPNPGYTFKGLYDEEDNLLCEENEYSLSVNSSRNFRVRFVQNPWPFKDMQPEDTLAEEVRYAYDRGIVGGFGKPDENGLVNYKPERNVTRAQFAIMLYNMAGRPEYECNAAEFDDVPEGASGYEEIMWASSNGIINGFSGNVFKPDNPISRTQIAIMLKKYADYMGYEEMYATDTDTNLENYADYSDIKEASHEFLKWAIDQGVLSGTASGKLNPNKPARRDHCAAFLARFYGRFIEN